MRTILNHVILILGCLFLILPLWVAFASSTHTPETLLRHGLQVWFGDQFWATYKTVLFETGGVTKTSNAARMLMNSLVLGLGFAVGKIVISMLAAYAIVYFRFRLAQPMFWLIFLTLLLPFSGHRIGPAFPLILYYNQIVGSLMKIHVFFRLDQQSWTRQDTALQRDLSAYQRWFNRWSSRAMTFSAASLFAAIVITLGLGH